MRKQHEQSMPRKNLRNKKSMRTVLSRATAAVAIAAFTGLQASASARTAPNIICDGLIPTVVLTNADDTWTGTDQREIVWAGNGNDTLDGKGGDDVLCGGPGRDRINGGAGNDMIRGGDHSDYLLEGGNGNDIIKGGDGRDTIRGGNGNDELYGQGGNDNLNGGAGVDLLDGGSGSDTCAVSSADLRISCEG